MGNVVDFRQLAQAVPIRLQINTMCTRNIFFHSAKIVNSLISIDGTSKVGEKQFSDVRKGCKSRESKIEAHCCQFAGLTCSPYFAAPDFIFTKCATELNRAADASRAKSKIAATRYNTIYQLCTAVY